MESNNIKNETMRKNWMKQFDTVIYMSTKLYSLKHNIINLDNKENETLEP